MAKKKGIKAMSTGAASAKRTVKPVRLDLTIEDHERLARNAKRYGLSKSSYVRIALFKWMEADEREGGGK